jgi:hypothetical protein
MTTETVITNISAVTVSQGHTEAVLVLMNAAYCKAFVVSYSTKLI